MPMVFFYNYFLLPLHFFFLHASTPIEVKSFYFLSWFFFCLDVIRAVLSHTGSLMREKIFQFRKPGIPSTIEYRPSDDSSPTSSLEKISSSDQQESFLEQKYPSNIISEVDNSIPESLKSKSKKKGLRSFFSSKKGKASSASQNIQNTKSTEQNILNHGNKSNTVSDHNSNTNRSDTDGMSRSQSKASLASYISTSSNILKDEESLKKRKLLFGKIDQ